MRAAAKVVVFTLVAMATTSGGLACGETHPVAPTVGAEVAALGAEIAAWRRSDPEMALPVARALHRASRDRGLDLRALVGLVRVENPWLKPDTVSYAGAVGIMQVIPRYWLGVFPECGDDLTDIEDNVCVGSGALAHFIDRADGDMARALLRYNGCRGGPCSDYPELVMRFASRGM